MKIIIPIFVGAVIGYFTNWLAIKMLFRPLEVKKVFGLKIPFTPGLIPKERKRIASSIGETVGKHLLTPGKISEVLSSNETKTKMKGFIVLKLNGLKENNKSLSDIFKHADEDKYNWFLDSISEKISTLFIKGLRDEELKESLIVSLANIYDKHKDEMISKLSSGTDSLLNDVKTSTELKVFFMEVLNNGLNDLKNTDRKLEDMIPESLIMKVNSSIDENKKEIMDAIREFYYKPDIQKAIKTSIETLVEENISKMITMFIDSATISEKVFAVISRYVDSNQAEETASFVIKDFLNNIANMEVSSVAEYIVNLIDEEESSNLYSFLMDYIFKEENKRQLIELFIENIRLRDSEIKSYIMGSLTDIIDEIINSNSFYTMVKEFMNKNINQLFSTPISVICQDIDDETTEKIVVGMDRLFNIILKEELYDIISLFNISEIIEEQINGFEVEYTEQLILNIADRELKAITRLGALLGAIMGLLTPILQMI